MCSAVVRWRVRQRHNQCACADRAGRPPGRAQALGVPAPQVRGVRAVHCGRRRPAVPLPGLRERCAAAAACHVRVRERLAPFPPCCDPVRPHRWQHPDESATRGRDLRCCLPASRARALTAPGRAAAAAYCEDHLPHDADILQICPRFQYLGQLHPRPVRGPARARTPPLLAAPAARTRMRPCCGTGANGRVVRMQAVTSPLLWALVGGHRMCIVKAQDAVENGLGRQACSCTGARALDARVAAGARRRALCTAARTAARSRRACRTCLTRPRSSRSSARPRRPSAPRRPPLRRRRMRRLLRPRPPRPKSRRLVERRAAPPGTAVPRS